MKSYLRSCIPREAEREILETWSYRRMLKIQWVDEMVEGLEYGKENFREHKYS